MRTLAISVCALGFAIAGAAAPATDCPSVRDVKLLPFYSEYGRDLAYDRLRSDNGCEYVLRKTLTSRAPSRDIRESPFGPVNYVLGDTAFFILAEKYDVQLEDTLDPAAKAEWKEMGVFAYFSYVSDYANRKKAAAALIERVEAIKKARAKP